MNGFRCDCANPHRRPSTEGIRPPRLREELTDRKDYPLSCVHSHGSVRLVALSNSSPATKAAVIQPKRHWIGSLSLP
jgi:hypothetical protein